MEAAKVFLEIQKFFSSKPPAHFQFSTYRLSIMNMQRDFHCRVLCVSTVRLETFLDEIFKISFYRLLSLIVEVVFLQPPTENLPSGTLSSTFYSLNLLGKQSTLKLLASNNFCTEVAEKFFGGGFSQNSN